MKIIKIKPKHSFTKLLNLILNERFVVLLPTYALLYDKCILNHANVSKKSCRLNLIF